MKVHAEAIVAGRPQLMTGQFRPLAGRLPASLAAVVMTVVLVAVTAPATAIGAGTLYRWSEPDGALTFSPTPPADGTAYEEVDPMTMKPLDEASTDSKARASISASTPTAGANAAAGGQQPVGGAGNPGSEVDGKADSGADPGVDARALGAAISAQADSAQPSSSTGTRQAPPETTTRATNEEHSRTPAATKSNDKEQRCKDLQKRVTSLERRLATPLTAADMDNTVVHMARYQQSHERHCR